jgi:hypothetical protein
MHHKIEFLSRNKLNCFVRLQGGAFIAFQIWGRFSHPFLHQSIISGRTWVTPPLGQGADQQCSGALNPFQGYDLLMENTIFYDIRYPYLIN